MSDRVFIFDTTLRDGEQSPGATMNQAEKIRLARQLETLGVDVIEAGFPAASQGDAESVRAIAEAVREAQVACLCRAVRGDIEKGWEAVRTAAKPRIHTFLATSPLHMEHKLRKSPAEVLAMIEAAVTLAAGFTANVEFSAEDASRSEPEFLATAIETAIAAGATTVNIPDTVGYAQPAEFAELIRYLLGRVAGAAKAVFSVHCHNDLGLGVANTLAALKAGARQAEVTLSGIGERAGNAALEEVVMGLATRREYYGLATNIRTEQLYPSCRRLARIIGQEPSAYKPIIGANAFAHESGIHQDGVLKNPLTYEIMTPASIGRTQTALVIGKHSGRHALKRKLDELNYVDLTDDQVDVVFHALKDLADKKQQIFDEDVEALVLEKVYRRKDKYVLRHVSVLSGNICMDPTAAVIMDIDGEEAKHSTFGVGPVDAVFNAVSHLVGRKPSLEQFSINAITGGTDAQGEVLVRIRDNGATAVGRGFDPDIIVASAIAYVSALNSLAKKEEEKR
jgi:2-isopropylmalate synthase